MSGLKRKASRASPHESPSKLSKNRSSLTVGGLLGELRKIDTPPRPTFTPPKFPSVRKSTSKASSSASPGATVSSLRKAPTLPLADDGDDTGAAVARTMSKKGSSTTSLNIPENTVTTIRKLPSGASVGHTASEDSDAKVISKKSSIVRKESLVKSLSVSSTKSPSREGSKLSMWASASKGSTAHEEEEDMGVVDAVGPPLPPGGLMEIVFSFDTTGSMSSCLDQVRGRVSDMIQRLQSDIPSIRIAVFAHGDYCDASNYVTKWIDFGSTLPELCDFVKNVTSTGGGDFEECYELVLRQARAELSWTPGSQRALVMIGDATPHEPSYYKGKEEIIKWQDECNDLKHEGIRIYAVQALNNNRSTDFYKSLASLTGGRHVKLDQFSNIFDMMMAICYREHGADLFEGYEDEVRSRFAGGKLNKDLEGIFSDLRGHDSGDEAPSTSAASSPSLKRAKNTGKTTKAKVTKKKATKEAVAPKAGKEKKKTKVVATKVKGKRKSGKRLRENVSQAVFKTNVPVKMTWSKWYLGMSSSPPLYSSLSQWKKFGGTKKGFRRVALFTRDMDTPAVFEFAVQLAPKGKRFTTFFRSNLGLKSTGNWFTSLVSQKPIVNQIEAVLQNPSVRIFARRGVVSLKSKKAQVTAVKKVETVLLQDYDYSWLKNRSSKTGRVVKKNGIHISQNAF